MGAVSPNGTGTSEFWRNTRDGVHGVSTIDSFDTSWHRVKIAGSVRDLGAPPARNVPETLYDRVSTLAKVAADEALHSSGVHVEDIPPARVGIILGMGLSGMQSVQNWHKDFFVDKTGVTVDDFVASFPNSPAAILAMEYGVRGLNYTVNTACSSSGAAVGMAFLLIRGGVLDFCIAGGADAPLAAATLKNFETLRVLNSKSNDQPGKASRPFSADRHGFVLAEGAGIFVLEAGEHLERRRGEAVCEVIGYGSSNDATHILAPDKNGQVLSVEMALKDAGIDPSQVAYIHAHGTGTKLNDLVETEVIKEVFRERAQQIPISSVKSMIGHTIGASAALSMICTAMGMTRSFLPPTINLDVPDPQLDLDYVPNSGRSIEAEVAVVNAFGFGGNNNVIVLRRLPTA